jgi:hypothetical protein
MNEAYLFSLFDDLKVIIELLHRKGTWDRVILQYKYKWTLVSLAQVQST